MSQPSVSKNEKITSCYIRPLDSSTNTSPYELHALYVEVDKACEMTTFEYGGYYSVKSADEMYAIVCYR